MSSSSSSSSSAAASDRKTPGMLGQDSQPDMEIDRKGAHKTKKVIVVLEQASLETVKTKKGYELASADSHAGLLKKLRKDAKAADFRPDILHRCLLTLQDSPLNKAGHLQVYVHTTKNVLIELSPQVRIARTYRRFAGLMVQLLHRMKIRASDGNAVLLKVIKNPMVIHLPAGAPKIGTSKDGDFVSIDRLVAALPPNEPAVFVVGAHAHGPCEVDYTERVVCISRYALAASVVSLSLSLSFYM